MFSSLLFLSLITFYYQADAELLLQGTAKVKELIEKMELNCLMHKVTENYSINRLNIQKGDEIFASVDSKGNVDFLRNDMDMKAVGYIDQEARNAFLNLTIGKPLRKLTSKYICSASAVSRGGFEQQFTSSELQVEVKVPSDVETNSYLVKKVHHLNQLFTQIDHLALVDKKEIESYNNKMDGVSRELNENLTALTRQYIKTGRIRCDSLNHKDTIHREWFATSTYVRFTSSFSKPPRVMLRLRMGEIQNTLEFFSEAREVKDNGFYFVCGTRENTDMPWSEFMWIAFE